MPEPQVSRKRIHFRMLRTHLSKACPTWEDTYSNVKQKIKPEDVLPFPERGYDWIHALEDKIGTTIPQLLALSRQHDPWYVGSNLDLSRARWFAGIWDQLGYRDQTGVHLRRVHYRLVDTRPKKLNGKPYENTDADWQHLLICSQAARILNLVPADAFEDRRNAEPYVPFKELADSRVPQVVAGGTVGWTPPAINLRFWEPSTPGVPSVYGYDPDDELDRAYLLEVWIEKSTQDDILKPLCRELGVTLVTSVGFQSITSAVRLLKHRVNLSRKPARVFYISDFDKAGDGMPVAVARQIEFWLPVYAPGAEVKLQHLALTREQVGRFRLPRDSKGRVELDALEARRPGALATLVHEAVAPYLDDTIPNQLAQAKREAERMVEEQWTATMEPHARKLRTINKQVRSIMKMYEKEVAALNRRLQSDVAKFERPLQLLQAAVNEAADCFDPDLPDRPSQAVTDIEDEQEWLFDSSREYEKQLRFYKAHQGKTSSHI